MGGMHAQIYNALPGIELIAIADYNVKGTQNKLAGQEHKPQVFANLSELLATVDVDIVDICSPTDQHLDLAIESAKAGKHIFIEKPLALDLPSCTMIQRAVDEAGVKAQVGQCIRFWPEYVALKTFIDSGKGGKLKSLSLLRRAGRPGYSQQNWLNNHSRSGGAAFDLHIHDTDFIIHLLGLPESVTSQTTQGESGPDHIFTQYQYGSVAVQAEGGWDYPEQYGFCMAFEAVFENACISYNSVTNEPLTCVIGTDKPQPIAVEQAGPKDSSLGEGNLSSLGGYYNELAYFVSCLEADQAPAIATLPQAADSVRVVLAELESAQKNQTINL